MRKTLIVSLSIALLLSLWVYAIAGIGPSKGLPIVTVSGNDNNKWNVSLSNTAVTMNNGSVMCVDCHTRNPSTRAPLTSFPGGAFSRNFIGSHFVTNNFADTNTGGGYPGAISGIRSNNDFYVKRDAAWPTTNIMSKYGRLTGGSLFSDNTVGAWAGKQLICESCHNVTRNFGRYKLLGSIDNVNLTADSNLCAGCHADMRLGINNEPSYFDNTTPGNQHHRHYQPETIYGGANPGATAHTSELISNTLGYYGPPSKLWAASFGQLTGLPRNAQYVTSSNPGIKGSPITAGMIYVDNSATLYCITCHRAHNAVASTGALILKTGDNAVSTWGGSGVPAAGYEWQALRRQSDFGDPAVFTNRLIRDDRPLCNGCHQNR